MVFEGKYAPSTDDSSAARTVAISYFLKTCKSLYFPDLSRVNLYGGSSTLGYLDGRNVCTLLNVMERKRANSERQKEGTSPGCAS